MTHHNKNKQLPTTKGMFSYQTIFFVTSLTGKANNKMQSTQIRPQYFPVNLCCSGRTITVLLPLMQAPVWGTVTPGPTPLRFGDSGYQGSSLGPLAAEGSSRVHFVPRHPPLRNIFWSARVSPTQKSSKLSESPHPTQERSPHDDLVTISPIRPTAIASLTQFPNHPKKPRSNSLFGPSMKPTK